MFMQNIVAASEDEFAGCPISRDLALLAASLDTRFLRAGNTLAAAVDMIDQIIGGLDGIAAALDEKTAGAAVADMRYVAGRLNMLPRQLQRRGSHITTVKGTAARLGDHVLEINSILRILGIYAMNIKIASFGEESFVGFVEKMKTRLVSGEQHIAGFISELKILSGAITNMEQADRLLGADSAGVVPAVPDRLAGDAGELSVHLAGVARLASDVADIARSVQAKVAIVLGALQIGDRTRQRLEHVVSALQMVEARRRLSAHALDPAAVDHINRMLAAQIEATAVDYAHETEAMLRSLSALQPDTEKLLSLIAEHGDAGSREFLARLERGISDVEGVTIRLRDAEERSRAIAVTIAEAVRDLSRRLAGVKGIRLDVQDIAVNTRLLCRRHGMIGKAVSVVAVDVDAQTVALGMTTFSVAAAIDTLETAGLELQGDHADGGGRDMGDMLAAALAVVRRACQRTENAMMKGGDGARGLIDLLINAGDDFDCHATTDLMMSASGKLADSQQLPIDDAAAFAEACALLVEIEKLYTMASERVVHDSFLLPGMQAAASVPETINEDDEDDGLF